MKPLVLSKAEWREEKVLRWCDRLSGFCSPHQRIRFVSGTWYGRRLATLVWRTYRRWFDIT